MLIISLLFVLLYLQRIQLHFNRFELKNFWDTCQDDKVYVYDGGDATVTMLQTVCHVKFTAYDIISSGNMVFVYFESDHNERRHGFEIQYSSVEGKSGCHG